MAGDAPFGPRRGQERPRRDRSCPRHGREWPEVPLLVRVMDVNVREASVLVRVTDVNGQARHF